ncbi:MAG: ATP-binding protein [Promethearchaeota archaeon]
MLSEHVIDFQVTIFFLIGSVFFFLVYLRNRDLKYYIPGYISAPFGYFIYYLHYYYYFYRLLGNIIMAFGTILFMLGALVEYFSITKNKIRIKKNSLILLIPSIISIIAFQIIIIICLFIGIILIINIYLIQKTPRHLALALFLCSGAFSATCSILNTANITGALELSFLAVIIFTTLFVIFPIIAYIEDLMLKVEKDLIESEEKFRTITEQSFMGIIIVQGGKVLYMNKAVSVITGYPLEEILQWSMKQYIQLIHPEDAKTINERVQKNIEGDVSPFSTNIFRIIDKKGDTKWIADYTARIIIEGKVANIISLMDVTDRVEAEQIILEENKKLIELDQMRQNLLTRISHELKTPLTSIFGVSQYFMGSIISKLDDNMKEFLIISHRGILRLKELIDNLIDASQFNMKKIKLRIENISLNKLIKDCARELSYLISARNLELRLELINEIDYPVDKIRITQTLINLISNSIKNTPAGGKIILKLQENNKFVDIIVEDNGVGLTSSEKEKLFKKFGKIERYGQNLDVDIEGAGLGLFISKEIVELHKGKILVESKGRNQGAKFIIRLYK